MSPLVTTSKATGFREPEEGVSADRKRNAPDEAGHEIRTFAPCWTIRRPGNGLILTCPSTWLAERTLAAASDTSRSTGLSPNATAASLVASRLMAKRRIATCCLPAAKRSPGDWATTTPTLPWPAPAVLRLKLARAAPVPVSVLVKSSTPGSNATVNPSAFSSPRACRIERGAGERRGASRTGAGGTSDSTLTATACLRGAVAGKGARRQ